LQRNRHVHNFLKLRAGNVSVRSLKTIQLRTPLQKFTLADYLTKQADSFRIHVPTARLSYNQPTALFLFLPIPPNELFNEKSALFVLSTLAVPDFSIHHTQRLFCRATHRRTRPTRPRIPRTPCRTQ